MFLLTVHLFSNVECFFIRNMKFQDFYCGKTEVPKEIFLVLFFSSWHFSYLNLKALLFMTCEDQTCLDAEG